MLFHFDENIRTCHIVPGIIDEKVIAALLWHVIRRKIRLRNIHTQRVHFCIFFWAICPSRENTLGTNQKPNTLIDVPSRLSLERKTIPNPAFCEMLWLERCHG
jgi:hypothetical protein